MKKESADSVDTHDEEMKAEFRSEYSKARPNRFAERMDEKTVAVMLDPDVASVFQTSDAVNSALRSVIKATASEVVDERLD